ncbi:MAG: FecR family protein [Oligoflexia bacterium]|nr:FecR family protein [Oligoflexia bacterium]
MKVILTFIYLLNSISLSAAITAEPIGFIENLSGIVVVSNSSTEKRNINIDDPVYIGDSLMTEANSWIDVVLMDESKVRVSSSTIYVFSEEQSLEQSSNLLTELIRGSLRVWIKSEEGDNVKFELKTKFASVGVRGTEFLASMQDEMEVYTISGDVLVAERSEDVSSVDWSKASSVKNQEMAKVGVRKRGVIKERFKNLPSRFKDLQSRPFNNRLNKNLKNRILQLRERRNKKLSTQVRVKNKNQNRRSILNKAQNPRKQNIRKNDVRTRPIKPKRNR